MLRFSEFVKGWISGLSRSRREAVTLQDDHPTSGYRLESNDWPERVGTRAASVEEMIAFGRAVPEAVHRRAIEDLGSA